MATYTPITITHENISWALNENIRVLIEVLETKQPAALTRSLLAGLDAGGLKILESAPATTAKSAVTLAQLQEY